MKIFLYCANKILIFFLPKKISGSFSFDENPEENAKLINVDARGNDWVLYSTSDVNVIENNQSVMETSLKPDHFYALKKGEKTYLIYVTSSFDTNYQSYSFNGISSLEVGNSANCNIYYKNSLIQGSVLKLSKTENGILLEPTQRIVYVNNEP